MIAFEDFAGLTDVQWRSRHEVERGIYVAEGTKTIERALRAGHRLRSVVTELRWVDQLLALGVDARQIATRTQAELETLTGYHVHRGALAAFERPPLLAPDELTAGARRLVVLEDIVDHTNVGAIMRSAAAFEIDGVLLTQACADPLYRRAIKVSIGAVFAVPWARIPSGTQWLQQQGFVTVALTPDPTAVDIRALTDATRQSRLALLLGTEGQGLSGATMRDADVRVRIPMSRGVDSLNVAAAAAVACFELTR